MNLKKQVKRVLTRTTSIIASLRPGIDIAMWEKGGRPAPPPHKYKQQVLVNYAKKYKLTSFVETGTNVGDMVAALRPRFKQVFSIELSKELFDIASQRFKRAKNVTLLHGDSGKILGRVVEKLDGPALFWLDGHYSGAYTAKGEQDTPVVDELKQILRSPRKGDVIVIDDARCFGTNSGYPSIDELFSLVRSERSDLCLSVLDDSIRITP